MNSRSPGTANSPADVERRIAAVEALVPQQADGGPGPSAGSSDLDAQRDLQAEIFRLREALDAQRTDADHHYGRNVDLERRVVELEEYLRSMEAQLRSADQRLEAASAQLDQALRLPALLEAVEARSAMEADIRILHRELDVARAHARRLHGLLDEVLHSRSWSLTRPLRRVVERLRGRRWQEPRVPELPPATPLLGDGGTE